MVHPSDPRWKVASEWVELPQELVKQAKHLLEHYMWPLLDAKGEWEESLESGEEPPSDAGRRFAEVAKTAPRDWAGDWTNVFMTLENYGEHEQGSKDKLDDQFLRGKPSPGFEPERHYPQGGKYLDWAGYVLGDSGFKRRMEGFYAELRKWYLSSVG